MGLHKASSVICEGGSDSETFAPCMARSKSAPKNETCKVDRRFSVFFNSDFMGFYRDLMGYEWGLPVGNLTEC